MEQQQKQPALTAQVKHYGFWNQLCNSTHCDPAIHMHSKILLWVEKQGAAVSLIILTLDDGTVSEALDMNLNFKWLITLEDCIAYCRTFRVWGCGE